MENTYKLAWRTPDGSVRTSAVSYSLAAAEDREKQLVAEHAPVRIVEVSIGQDVPAAVINELKPAA